MARLKERDREYLQEIEMLYIILMNDKKEVLLGKSYLSALIAVTLNSISRFQLSIIFFISVTNSLSTSSDSVGCANCPESSKNESKALVTFAGSHAFEDGWPVAVSSSTSIFPPLDGFAIFPFLLLFFVGLPLFIKNAKTIERE